ncbi:hypothetical protein P2H44_01425 [Albimonas sp. CAU 1670]|uniref:hypothetical protein n=1 Tax=Albimonas sp. CAU 1670 TaxID=3032599 RepID=UPI0023DA1BEE|nr:hypothetical protein [Albimonas sp. CAU 1670]MDF2231207.1 hypothetical protein [Albimonas sp. CAU 1670]
MFSFLGRLETPVKFALVGALGGFLANLLMILAGFPPPEPLATIVGLGVGGFVGGLFHQRRKGG